MRLINAKLASAAMAACVVAGGASAATFYTDAASWEAAMSSTAAVTLPATGATAAFSAGDLVFTRDGGASNLYVGTAVEWSTLIAGDDLAISGPEDVRIDFGTAVTGFSFLLHEPSSNTGLQPDSCNAKCEETTFNFKLYSGASMIGSFDFDPLNDVANFVGFSSALAFDSFVIDDVTGGIDNEFFGEFRTGTIAPVPVPAGLPLLLAGLGGLALVRRRRARP